LNKRRELLAEISGAEASLRRKEQEIQKEKCI